MPLCNNAPITLTATSSVTVSLPINCGMTLNVKIGTRIDTAIADARPGRILGGVFKSYGTGDGGKVDGAERASVE